MNSDPRMNPLSPRSRQRGAALVTSLIILLILTILGVSAMSGSSLEEMMAGNLRDQSVAFDAAEAALRDGERRIESWGGVRPIAATDTTTISELYIDGVVLPSAVAPCADYGECPFDLNIWGDVTTLAWGTGTSGLAQAYSLGNLSSTAPPLYIIEELGDITGSGSADWRAGVSRSGITMYRITARGSGLSGNSVVLLQITYGKRFL